MGSVCSRTWGVDGILFTFGARSVVDVLSSIHCPSPIPKRRMYSIRHSTRHAIDSLTSRPSLCLLRFLHDSPTRFRQVQAIYGRWIRSPTLESSPWKILKIKSLFWITKSLSTILYTTPTLSLLRRTVLRDFVKCKLSAVHGILIFNFNVISMFGLVFPHKKTSQDRISILLKWNRSLHQSTLQDTTVATSLRSHGILLHVFKSTILQAIYLLYKLSLPFKLSTFKTRILIYYKCLLHQYYHTPTGSFYPSSSSSSTTIQTTRLQVQLSFKLPTFQLSTSHSSYLPTSYLPCKRLSYKLSLPSYISNHCHSKPFGLPTVPKFLPKTNDDCLSFMLIFGVTRAACTVVGGGRLE